MDIAAKPYDGTTNLSSTSSGGTSTENLDNQTNVFGCDRGHVILDSPLLKNNIQDHLCYKFCNSKKVESELGGFFYFTERNNGLSKKEALWKKASKRKQVLSARTEKEGWYVWKWSRV